MTQVRYGARAVEQRRNREIEATKGEIWSQALTAIYETDPEVIAAVLPRPLEPPGAEPFVRVTLTTVEMPGGYTFGAGYFAVRAAHEGTEGEYPLLMPMTTEQATVGGRETFGEPKKIGEVRATRDGDAVEGLMARMGFTLVEIRGRVVETLPVPPERTKTDFYFKFLPAPDGDGFDNDPALVYCHKQEKMRLLAARRRRPRAEGLAARPDRRHPRAARRRHQLERARDVPVRRDPLPRALPSGCCRSRTSATTTCRCWGSRAPGTRTDATCETTTATSSSRRTATRGLPCEEYRPYLDAKYHDAFDAYVAERQAVRDQRMADSGDYITSWEEDNAEGLRGAYDPAQRDKELDGDGVAGEVLFPDADAITGGASPPFGAGLSAADIADPELAFAGARAHNRFLAELCARQPGTAGRCRAGPDHPRRRPRGHRDRMGGRQRVARRHPRPDDVARPRAVPRSGLRTGVGRVRGRRSAGAHALGFRADGRVPGERRRLPRRGRVVGGPAHVVPAVRRRVRTAPEPEVLHHRVRRVLGPRPHVEVGHLPGWRAHHEEARRASSRAR